MTALGRYRIFDKLGTGSMGTVYRAQDTVLEREVALKTIRTEGDVHPELRERFYREARACARLQHPSIVVVHDLGEIDQVAYIAMELLDGSDFRKLIEQRSEIPLATKLEVMAQVCDALAYAHRRGIIHRDIKPSNLFLIEGRHAKVLDFGIARLPSSQLTQAGKILGTPNYMAPEQILGKSTDGRSDLFSTAVVFFEFLVFAHPFQGESIPKRIVEEPPDALRAAERRLPILLERVFARGLAKEPDRRYQTGDEFAADLRAVSDLLLQNASPSFSRAPLPSERDVAARTAPPAEDLYENLLSELMQLIPEFEDSMAQGDTEGARQILQRLEAIGAADSRCAEPVRLCRARLAEPSPTPAGTAPGAPEPAAPGIAPVAQSPSTDPGTGSGMKTCAYCGAENRGAAVYCIRCGARMAATAPAAKSESPPAGAPSTEARTEQSLDATALFARSAVMPVPARIPQRADVGETAAAAKPSEAVPPPSKPVAESAPPPAQPLPEKPRKRGLPLDQFREVWRSFPNVVRNQKQVAVLATALLAAIAGMIIIALSFQPAKPRQWRVQALVKPPTAVIHIKPDQKSKGIRAFSGEKINILETPRAGQVWVPVQLVRKDRVTAPGYMRSEELEKWHSYDDATELKLMVRIAPEPPANEEAVQQRIYDLYNLINKVPNAPDAPGAYIQMARLELALAQSMKDAGRPDTDWMNHLNSARTDLDLGGGGADGSMIEEYRRQIAALSTPVSPPPVQPATTTANPAAVRRTKIDRFLKNANQLYQESKGLDHDAEVGKLKEAEAVVEQVLALQRDNAEAQELQRQISLRREFLEKFRK